ncbi:hypothetical protein quinque_012059 [Culex quinquefasciatus]
MVRHRVDTWSLEAEGSGNDSGWPVRTGQRQRKLLESTCGRAARSGTTETWWSPAENAEEDAKAAAERRTWKDASVWISGRLRKPDNGPTSGRHVEFGGGRFGKRFGLARTDRSETAEAAGVDVWPRGTIGDHGNLVVAGGECGGGRESSRRAAHVEDAVAGERE